MPSFLDAMKKEEQNQPAPGPEEECRHVHIRGMKVNVWYKATVRAKIERLTMAAFIEKLILDYEERAEK